MEEKAKVFEFTSYQFLPQEKRVVFHYATKFRSRTQLDWTETVLLPKVPNTESARDITKLLEGLHIMLGISYWKFHIAKEIKLPYSLSREEAVFWNTLYKKGLGEFLYKNNLDPSISPKFQASKNATPAHSNSRIQNTKYKVLVGIGGGKDSIVSAELLKEAGFDITSFNIELNKPSEVVDNIMKIIGAPQLKLRRVLDEKVHQKPPYNGHIPISAIYAFLGAFACVLYGYKYFIVSNEHSSNFGNITYKGLDINHQWSKSFEFETLFQNYIKNIVGPVRNTARASAPEGPLGRAVSNGVGADIQYFSLLRPFYEIRIVKMFSRMKKYFPYFSSCNRNFRIKDNAWPAGASSRASAGWCGQCAKCVFAFAMFSAVLPKKELLGIFGEDLQAKAELQPLFKDISGQGSMKPFDCVGTFEEVQEALGIKKHPEVWQTQKENAVPEEFKFLGMETVQIVREEGQEGQATKKFLKKFYPKLKTVAKNADITIKTPGVNKSQMTGNYTTPTNIFFGALKGKNLIIGVTGSKGKSTTTSLIYHILKSAGKRVEIMGNIGIPMIERLTKPVAKDTIFVLELSSFQLDDIKYSPDIAVATNLFPEHMDFHGSLKNYYEAKKNIIKTADHFVYNPKNLIMRQWVKNFNGKAIPFSTKQFESALLGEHNRSNIGAAAAVSEILKIPASDVKKGIESFEGLPHRLENIGTFKGITFYDDAISTTPDSTIMAVKALSKIDTIFLGGQDRGYSFTQLEKIIRQHKIKNVVLFPDSGKKILHSKKGFNILETKSMKEAVAFAYKNTENGNICLLSCASPSYSLWENFEEKGDQFKKYVKMMGKK